MRKQTSKLSRILLTTLACASPLACARASAPVTRTPDDYVPGPDSKAQPGVPKGEILKVSFNSSKIFPGTHRDYWVYVPAQYKGDQPACVYVQQDGLRFEAPV